VAGGTSLRTRCFRDIVLVTALAWALLTAGLVALVRAENARVFDEELQALAHSTLSFVAHELAEVQASGGTPIGEDVEGMHDNRLLYQVWNIKGQLALRSAQAPTHPIATGEHGLSTTVLNGEPMRVYAAWNGDHSFQVQAARPLHLRDRQVWRASLITAGAMALALLIFLPLLHARLRHAFTSLDATADELTRAPAGQLQPVAVHDKPSELQPVILAFNQMMARVHRALQHEQRFTSDAAHELKTPLAGLKILLRNAQRADDEHGRADALTRMDDVLDRANRLVDQLLALARYDSAPHALHLDDPVDLERVCADAIVAVQALAMQRGITIEPRMAEPSVVLPGHRDSLGVLMRNLLDNAIKHGPAHSRVIVQLCVDGDEASLSVHDEGPGIPESMRERVFGRFVRGWRANAGTGLGLAIAERIVHLHGGRIELLPSTLLGGTAAMVHLPRHRPAAAARPFDAPAGAEPLR
jgi:two-component system, OmpR family, sensor histidine kinase QseC